MAKHAYTLMTILELTYIVYVLLQQQLMEVFVAVAVVLHNKRSC